MYLSRRRYENGYQYPVMSTSGYTHFIIRLTNKNGKVIEDYEECISSFAEGWGATVSKSINWSLAVAHTYSKPEEGQAPHIHVAYRNYKCSPGEKFIKKFCQRLGLRLYCREVRKILGLAKYLLQGSGRRVLHETGTSRPDGLQGGGDAVRQREETYGYDFSSNSEGDETCGSDGEEDRKAGPREDVARQAKAIRKASGTCMEELNKVETVKRLLIKYRCKDEPNLKRKMDNNEKAIFNEIMLGTKEWTKIWSTAREEAMTGIMDKWWEDVLTMLPDDPTQYSPPVMSVNKSLKVLTAILDKQGWDKEQRKQFLCDVYSVMNNNILRRKRNTLYFIGKTSAGKTLIATSLELSKVFSFNSGEYNSRTSDFHFEDMATACIAILNEPQIEAGKVDKFKIILEGGAFDTNVKFKSKSRVEGVPVIVTTNHEIWRYAPEAAEPFEERLYRWTFTKKLSGIDISGGLHPKVWLKLIESYQLSRELFKEESEEEFDISQFGGPAAAAATTYSDEYSESEETAEVMHIPTKSKAVPKETEIGEATRAAFSEWAKYYDIELDDPVYLQEHFWPDFEADDVNAIAWRHAHIYSAVGKTGYNRLLSCYFGLCDFVGLFGRTSTELGGAGGRLIDKFHVDDSNCAVYCERFRNGGPDGSLARAERKEERDKLRQFIVSWYKLLEEHRGPVCQYLRSQGYESGDPEWPPALAVEPKEARKRMLRQLTDVNREVLNGNIEDGWLYGPTDFNGKPRKRRSCSSDGSQSSVRDRPGGKKEKIRNKHQGKCSRRDDVWDVLRQSERGETLPVYVCTCGYWLSRATEEDIGISGHTTCIDGWIGPDFVYEWGQEVDKCHSGWLIRAVNRETLIKAYISTYE